MFQGVSLKTAMLVHYNARWVEWITGNRIFCFFDVSLTVWMISLIQSVQASFRCTRGGHLFSLKGHMWF